MFSKMSLSRPWQVFAQCLRSPVQGHWERLCSRFLGHQLLTVHLHSVGMLSHVVIVEITVKSNPVNLWI